MSGKKHNKGRALHLLRKQAWQFFKKYKVASNKSVSAPHYDMNASW
jgi:hypothetical protein